MTKFYCTVVFDASRNVTVEASSPEEAAEFAQDEAEGSQILCHHCADHLDTGDALGAIVFDEKGEIELHDSRYYSPWSKREPLTEQQAQDMGAKGGEPTEAERLLFEAWMKGHCWAVVGDWDGKTYVHEQEVNGLLNNSAVLTRCLWAAWRDRAALGKVGA